MLPPAQSTFHYSTLSYTLFLEPQYKVQIITTHCLQSHCMFHSHLIHRPKFTDKIQCMSIALKLSLFGSFLLHIGIVSLQLCLYSADFLYFVLRAYRMSMLLKNSQMVFLFVCKIVTTAHCQLLLKR